MPIKTAFRAKAQKAILNLSISNVLGRRFHLRLTPPAVFGSYSFYILTPALRDVNHKLVYKLTYVHAYARAHG